MNCEKVKKSKKLLKFTIDDGSGVERTICSGIAAYYEPEQLIGKDVLFVANFAPRKMMKENLQAKEMELDLWIEEYNKQFEEKSIEGKDSEEEGIEERSIEPSLIDRNIIREMLHSAGLRTVSIRSSSGLDRR